MTAKQFITQLFRRWELGDAQSFFNALAEDLRWTAIGNTPISGTCTSLADYLEKVYRSLFERFSGPVQCQVKNIIAEGARSLSSDTARRSRNLEYLICRTTAG